MVSRHKIQRSILRSPAKPSIVVSSYLSWQETNGAAQDSAPALTDNGYRATALLVEPSETVNTGDTPGHFTAERHVITV